MPAPTFYDFFMVFLLANAAIVCNLVLIPQHLPTPPMVVPSTALEAALSCCARPPDATTPTPPLGNGSYHYSSGDQCSLDE